MSASTGQRARFHRNRKRSVLRRMRVRAVMAELKQQKAETAPAPPAPPRTRRGPALSGS